MDRAWTVDGPSIFCFYQAPKTRWENAFGHETFFSKVHVNRLEKQQNHDFCDQNWSKCMV